MRISDGSHRSRPSIADYRAEIKNIAARLQMQPVIVELRIRRLSERLLHSGQLLSTIPRLLGQFYRGYNLFRDEHHFYDEALRKPQKPEKAPTSPLVYVAMKNLRNQKTRAA
jgi:hypothetical protein